MAERDDHSEMQTRLDDELLAAGLRDARLSAPQAAQANASQRGMDAAQQFRDSIADIAATVLKIPRDRLDVRENMSRYGVDSIIVTEIMRRISDLLDQPIAPTVFFEARHLEELADILRQRYAKVVARRYTEQHAEPHIPADTRSEPSKVCAPSTAATSDARDANADVKHWISRFRAIASGASTIDLPSDDGAPLPAPTVAPHAYEPVAIIAMEGTFAQSADIAELEKHLRAGDDCIHEVPPDRWDWRQVYGDPREGEFTNVKYGGFAPDIDKFDPLFFGMSPREAELMDPQHRLFVQCCWKLIEQAGYAPRSLSGRKVGVFIGINLQDYAHLVDRAGEIEAAHLTSLGHMFCPNRLSFHLDIHGPSQVIDTACSSSLVALHRAALAVQHEGCEMAIAGGSNLLISPDMHVMYSKVGMICEDGRCKTFSRHANGYVRGDGVGAVLLKPLRQAERDGDTILAVIRGSAENHGGMSTSLTAPNPRAQADLIVEAHRKAGIDPRSVGYIECHGTGTSLGDPIEINGLKMAFAELHREAGVPADAASCGLGSIKSNIGHAETAAGIAGVIKAVLSIRNQRIYPTLHCHELNPMIELEGSPFYIAQQGAAWRRAVIEGREQPRRAAVSSFGAGGSNAHVVIEEYVAKPRPVVKTERALIVLSSRNETRLRELAADLARFLNETSDTALPALGDIAHTLQIGREAMAERLAFVVGSFAELKAKLAAIHDDESSEGIHRGAIKRGTGQLATANTKDLDQLGRDWTRGAHVDWHALHAGVTRRRVRLPTYPFTKQRYWIDVAPLTPRDRRGGATAMLHPLLHRDVSDLSERRFVATFKGREFFLADHVVAGDKVLPGVAYLEMARAAVRQAGAESERARADIRLKNVVWARPFVHGATPHSLYIGLTPEQDGRVAYRITSAPDADSESVLHGQGTALLSPAPAAPDVLDLAALRRSISGGQLDASQCYAAFAAMGMAYGPAHRCIERVAYSGATADAPQQALARLVLSEAAKANVASFVLHPGLIDSALQSCIGLMVASGHVLPTSTDDASELTASLPFGVDEFEVLSQPPADFWAWVRYAEGSTPGDRLQKLNIDLCDDDGRVCVRMRGFSCRMPERQQAGETDVTVICEPVWVKQPATAHTDPDTALRRTIVLCDVDRSFPPDLEQTLAAHIKDTACIRLTLGGTPHDWYADAAIGVFDTIKAELGRAAAGQSLVQVLVPDSREAALLEGLAGLIKTANRESSTVTAQLIVLDDITDLAPLLDAEARASEAQSHVRYHGSRREVLRWREIPAHAAPTRAPWKDNGVYLITGGAGGLGLILANDIAQNARNATVVLCGRSEESTDTLAELERLRATGLNARYRQCDIAQPAQVDALVEDILGTSGRLDGILHCAGLLRDNFIAKKTAREFEDVFVPKVTGTLNLDDATKDLDLDIFVLFASASGIFGSAAQADYAAANAFMDAFAHRRNALVKDGTRRGLTVSIDWPLWADGGMRMEPAARAMMRQTTGMDALPNASGLHALHAILASAVPQALVLHGTRAGVDRMLSGPKASPRANEESHSAIAAVGATLDTSELRTRIERMLLDAVTKLMKFAPEDVDADIEWSDLGFDSISLTDFSNRLNQQYRLDLTPTIFFEYPNAAALSAWLAAAHGVTLAPALGVKAQPVARAAPAPVDGTARAKVTTAPAAKPAPQSHAAIDTATSIHRRNTDAVAIVGMSGRFPMASDLDAFWDNLLAGRDCITEIPPDRWDWKAIYGDPATEPNKTNVKWGGFIDGAGDFDARFFGISPREAERMDPQQRLLMQYAWKAIEDAGHSAASLSGTRTGMFIATAPSGYAERTVQNGAAIESYSSTGAVGSIGPNRMSYFLNIHGPSEPIETACSSSLIAIHRAVTAMNNGDCEQAITGGTNLVVSPETHVSFNKAGMLSPDGRCKAFSRHANGYVRGEGVGMLFLKTLSAAERDGDHIYGVIRGSAENHGGRANSLTAPNPKAQAELLKTAYTRAGIDPRTVGYIEAHGTGTELGDPIEIDSLKAAFRDLYAASGNTDDLAPHCGLGSVKTNIGHLELAAGIAGVIKVLLQLRHKTLVRTLHCEDVNPYVRLGGSPFYLVTENREWTAPRDADGRTLPRRAGVSSFGFGGVNAHLVIEEYPEPQQDNVSTHPALIVLSAKNAERLKASAEALLSFVAASNSEAERPSAAPTLSDTVLSLATTIMGVARGDMELTRPLDEYGVERVHRLALHEQLQKALGAPLAASAFLKSESLEAIVADLLASHPALRAGAAATAKQAPRFRLSDLAYTLQAGRDAMDERLAIVAASVPDLAEKLRAFIDGRAADGLFVGQAKQNRSVIAAFGADEELREALEKWIARGKFDRLLDLWTKGLAIDWDMLYGEGRPYPVRPRRIPAPGYPFAEQRFWIDPMPAARTEVRVGAPVLHPLLHENVSTLRQVRFATRLGGTEFFLADHRVGGQKLLPGVAYLEMARAAADAAGARQTGMILRLSDVVWVSPAIVEQPRQFTIDLSPVPNGATRFEIASGDGDRQVHSYGQIAFVGQSEPPRIDLTALRASGMTRHEINACYALFAASGLDYGPAHRGITELHADSAQALARLALPDAVAHTLDQYVLHPSLMDCALQASIGLAMGHEAVVAPKMALPFAVETVDVLRTCTNSMWAWVRRRPGGSERMQKVDIDLCDENGRMCVHIGGFATRLFDADKRRSEPVAAQPRVPTPASLKQRAVTYFKELLAATLGFPVADIHADDALDSYGIDSMMVMELTRILERPFGQLSKTLFFEYQTLSDLVDYFLANHAAQVRALLAASEPETPAVSLRAEVGADAPPRAAPVVRAQPHPASRKLDTGALNIAIIGLSGRYPLARDIEAYWRNLREGRDCITEVPADRWDWRAYYSDDGAKPHTCKWGGFIEDVDKFDPLFFNISPSTAEYMDPQERLFLAHAWMAMEDAGYRRQDLQRPCAGAPGDEDLPGQVGVYAGVMYGEYQLLGLEAVQNGAIPALANFYASIANRVSYALNLHGPSMAVDTMCSSSLTAIHLACQDLRLGHTDLAFAGGVNVNLHPNKYGLLSLGQFISKNGKCESFGDGGDGYVPSEGVGVVLLKRLADAERDGDHIYGVIKSSSLNHGGKTNGYSVPNPKAQEAAISRALRDAGTDPRAIGYVEAHGTGTRLGDPIEIAGLTHAFARHRPDGAPCWIGSSKSNIGHSEAAAGIAGLTKVLLQMREGEIAPSLHSKTLNPNIDFAASPFQVNQELRAWPRPVIDGKIHRRAAGISSFGAGGANAHLIIEEYARPDATDVVRAPEPQAIVLSARTDEQLRQSVDALLQFVRRADAPSLRDIAHTLQVGREAMPYRLGFVANSMPDLSDKLERHLRNDRAGLHTGRAKRRDGDAAPADIANLIARRQYDGLLARWVEGVEIDWFLLYPHDQPSRVSLPTYPFARECYWIGVTDAERRSAKDVRAEAATRETHSAPQAEISTLLLTPVWALKSAPVDAAHAHEVSQIFTIGRVPDIARAIVTPLRSQAPSIDRSFRDEAIQLFEQIRQALRGKPPGLFQVVVGASEQAELSVALAVLLRTVRMENPQFAGHLVQLDDAAQRLGPDQLASLLSLEDGTEPCVRYRSGQREIPAWSELEIPSARHAWREGGTYLITGGAGGLGLIFAREIVHHVGNVTLILTGRSQIDAARQAQLDALRTQGARIDYRAVDVGNPDAVNALIASITHEGLALNGILHSAGITRDGFLLRKSAADFEAVLDPKVSGVVNLDLATRGIDLDFFVLFSSVSGAVGNPGQSDYATANAFMDAYAGYRNRLAAGDSTVRPSGHTLSINWPLWEHGGMTIADEAKEAMWRNAGLRPLRTEDGIAAFHRALHCGLDQVMVLQGDGARVRALFGGAAPASAETQVTPAASSTALAGQSNKERLAAKAEQLVANMLSEMLKLPRHRIETDVPLEQYGVDSVGMMKLTTDLEKSLGPLPKTLFFEYPAIADVAAYLAGAFTDKLSTLFDAEAPASRPAQAPSADSIVAQPVVRVPEPEPRPVPPSPERQPPAAARDIAIVGMSGRFPMADDLDTFWQNLAQGRDCITEVPPERWDHARYFDPDKSALGKTYCKWGGFMDGVDRFDARFFRIPPAEAELLDPQERLFLETVWNLLESSGYLGETLEQYDGRAGVFVGSMSQQYHAFSSDWVRSSIVSLTAPASIANRVSYFFNLQGPSIAIDTMCSSALTAVHMACESLLKGECRIAIAGGVNLTIHPKKYIALSAGQMVGSRPDSTSFGNGDGYLPAEGVGAVLLKPLHAAIADNDEILAVIKSTATNHGGQSNGYRVPSKSAQADLIAENFTRAGIDPRTVSYVESAANGSPLGDAIEVSALSAGFRQHTTDRQFCAIGSVKSNMGHAEAASGIAQLIKVILQMRHRQLAPSIKAEPLNPNIAFGDTPFRLQRTLEEWRQPVIALGGGAPQVYPRRATVSAFGAGGSNAHLIIEEYESRANGGTQAAAAPQLIPLSARTAPQLKALARCILTFAERQPELSLADLACTLQTSRETMDHRLAFVIANREQFLGTLRAWLDGASDIPAFTGSDSDDNSEIKLLLSGRAGKAMLDVLLAERDLEKLALYWAKGARITWQSLHGGRAPRRIALPTYPFERNRYWLADNPETDVHPAAATEARAFKIDPHASAQENMERYLREGLAGALGTPMSEVRADRSFQDHGASSIVLIRLRQGFERTFGVEISARDALAHSTPAALAAFAGEKSGAPKADAKAGDLTPVVAPEESAYLPLSEGQKGLWLLNQMAPQSSAYNVPIALRFDAGFDIAAFRQACALLLRRHPLLASTFGERNGEPYRTAPMTPHPSFTHETIAAQVESEIADLLRARAREPFDLARGPLMRVHVFSSGDNHHALITVHHIVIDGRSAALLVGELADAYAIGAAGGPLPAQPADTRFDEFVAWQQQFMESNRAQRQRDYWLAQLSGYLPILALPFDYPHATRGSGGASHEATLTPQTACALRDLARTREINMPAIFLGAWMLLLRRYSGDDDILVGMPTLGRPDARFDDAIGYFVNMIVIRSRISGARRTDDFLKELQFTIAGGLDNADYPFPLLRDALRSDGRDAAPRAMFAYQNFVQLRDVATGPAMHFVPGVYQEGTHDLALEVYESADSFRLRIDCDSGLFEPHSTRRAMAHIVHMLERIAAAPDTSITEHDPLPPDERQQIIAWSSSAPALDTDGDIVAMVRRLAEAAPREVALVCGAQSLTYRELDNRSTRLADLLRDSGVAPSESVGACMARGADMIVALLAIWKAGATYVPLAADLPEARLRHMIDDSRIAIAVADTAARNRIAAAYPLGGPRCVNAASRRRKASLATGSARLDPDRAAYILYTSGSTGQPKGVVVPHRAIGHHAVVMREHYRLTPQDKVLQFAAMSVDAALEQILPGLICGATIVIRPDTLWSASEFRQAVDRHGVTVADLPPSYLHEVLLDTAMASSWDSLRSLRLVITGGEVLASETLRLWRGSPLRDCRLVNAYGPTETTITSVAFDIGGDVDGNIPIGRPLPGETAFILDSDGQPVPIGVPGELYIGGAGLATGYLNQPELTAGKFIASPLDARERLYRTGDCARWLRDGSIAFLGRTDHQVKVRGFRVECGEVEAALRDTALVRHAAVVARPVNGSNELIAYVVRKIGDTTDLKQVLRRRLPEHMIPSIIVDMEELPLTPGGKVDRIALARRDLSAPGTARAFPTTPTEQQLAEIWRDVLKVDAGIDDDFFHLGGHSLLAVRATALIRQRMTWDISVSTLFAAPTIAAQAKLLDSGVDHSPLICLKESGERAPWFCVHAIAGDVLAYRELALHLKTARPVYALQVPDADHPGTIEALASRYIAAIRTVQPRGPYHLGGWSMGGVIAYEMAQRLRAAGERVATLSLIDSYTPDAVTAWEKTRNTSFAADTSTATFLANVRAMDRYVPRPYEGDARLFRASSADATDSGWSVLIGDGLTTETVPGDHDSIMRQPAVGQLAEALAGYLDEAKN